jgi:hypothetical protein
VIVGSVVNNTQTLVIIMDVLNALYKLIK